MKTEKIHWFFSFYFIFVLYVVVFSCRLDDGLQVLLKYEACSSLGVSDSLSGEIWSVPETEVQPGLPSAILQYI